MKYYVKYYFFPSRDKMANPLNEGGSGSGVQNGNYESCVDAPGEVTLEFKLESLDDEPSETLKSKQQSFVTLYSDNLCDSDSESDSEIKRILKEESGRKSAERTQKNPQMSDTSVGKSKVVEVMKRKMDQDFDKEVKKKKYYCEIISGKFLNLLS